MLTVDEITAARDQLDRSRTASFVAALGDPQLDLAVRGELEQALEVLDDLRAEAPLRALLLDRTAAPVARESAASVLVRARSMSWPHKHELEALHRDGDALLRDVALRSMDRGHEALLIPRLDDPNHAEHAAAVDALAVGFDHPRFTARCIAALTHPSAEVRAAGASSLLVTEPIDAIDPLLAVLDDPDPDVADAALETLGYMESRRVLEGLHAFVRRTSDADRRAAAENALRHVAHVLAFTLRCPGGDHPLVRAWLAPVGPSIETALAEIDRTDAPALPTLGRRFEVPALASLEAFRARYSGIDRPWTGLLDELALADWEKVPEAVRDALASELSSWPDVYVRHHAPAALAAWRDTERLVRLLDDPCPAVATTACYYLLRTEPSPKAALRVRERFDTLPNGAPRIEALRTFIALAAPSDGHRLIETILDDLEADEALRVEAAHLLVRPDAHDVAKRQIERLAAPPRIRWDLHEALLLVASAHHLETPDVAHLGDVDHCHVVEALARLETARASPGFSRGGP